MQSLFADLWRDQAIAEGVFEGVYSAKIFVDDSEQPQVALMAYSGGDYFLVGNPHSVSLLTFLCDAPSEAHVFNRPYFAYFTADTAWEQPLRDIGVKHFHPSRCFKHLASDFPPITHFQQKTRPDAQLQRVDEAFMADIERGVIGDLGHGLVYGRRNIRADFEWMTTGNRFAYVVTIGGAVASIAHAHAVSQRYAMLFIDTEERFWRQGLGNLACGAFIRHARQLNKITLWGCIADNAKSGQMAINLGFSEGTPCLESDWKAYGQDFVPSVGLWHSHAHTDSNITTWQKQ
jgi:hypothetical protein